MIRGTDARLRWGFYYAADIYGYAVTRTKDGVWHLTAQIVLSDAFKLAQRPLRFCALHRKGEWRWPIVTMAIDPSSHRLTAVLGPPEVIKAA